MKSIILAMLLLASPSIYASDDAEGEVLPMESMWDEAVHEDAESEKERQQAIAEGLIPENAKLEDTTDPAETEMEKTAREASEDAVDDAWHHSHALGSRPISFDMLNR